MTAATNAENLQQYQIRYLFSYIADTDFYFMP